MKNNLLSIIIPAFNEEENIQNTAKVVCGIMEEAKIPFEILFVSDGSKDTTFQKVLELATADSRIRGIEFSKNFGKDISKIIKPVLFVTKSKNVNDLMKELQSKKLHMAIVADEYGSTAGIVTLEDILEEIVGDIWDEHDDVIIDVREIGEGEYIVTGKANIEKVFSQIGIDVEPQALTVNGWAMDALARIPAVSDEFEADGLHAKVLKMNGRRIENLKITKLAPDEAEAEED